MDILFRKSVRFPCSNCVCLPVCKHKLLKVMFYQCKLIHIYWINFTNTINPQDGITKKVLMIMLKEANSFSNLMNRIIVPHVDMIPGSAGTISFHLYELSSGERMLYKDSINPTDTIQLYWNHGITIYKYKPVGSYLSEHYHQARDYDL